MIRSLLKTSRLNFNVKPIYNQSIFRFSDTDIVKKETQTITTYSKQETELKIPHYDIIISGHF